MSNREHINILEEEVDRLTRLNLKYKKGLEFYADTMTWLKDHASGARDTRFRVLKLDDLEQFDGQLLGGKLAREVLSER